MDFGTLYEENKQNIIILLGIVLLAIVGLVIFNGLKSSTDDNKKVTSIMFSEKNMTIEENKTYQIKYEIFPSGLNDIEIKWSSANEEIASVNESGLITANRPGSTIIIGKTKNGMTDNINIIVYERKKDTKSVVFDIENFDLKIKTYRRLYPIFTPEDVNYELITWSSSNETIATVSQIGLVTGVKTGSAVITASVKLKDGNYLSASSKVTITKETTLSLANSSSRTLREDTTTEVILAVSDSNVVVKQAVAEVSNENIVQVIRRPIADNENSTITSIIKGMGKGKATITYSVETMDGEIIKLEVPITVN